MSAAKGILLIVSGIWALATLYLIVLFIDDCRPNLPDLPAAAPYVGVAALLVIVCGPIAAAPDGPAALIRAAFVSGRSSLVAAIAWAIGVWRPRAFCEQVGHWAPGHHHRPIAGDIGPLLLYQCSAIALATSIPVIVACFVVGALWRRRKSAAS